MGGLAWLNDLMQWLSRWIPRLLLIRRGQAGVKFGPRGSVRRLHPNLHCYWPITHEVTVVSTRRRTMEIAAQLHGFEVIQVSVCWFVDDPVAVLTTWNDVVANVDDRTQAALARHVHSAGAQLQDAILGDIRQEFHGRGITIVTVDLLQRGFVLPIKNLGEWAVHEERTL